jgi:ribosomal protein L34E
LDFLFIRSAPKVGILFKSAGRQPTGTIKGVRPMGDYPLTGPYVTLLIIGIVLLHVGAFLLRLAWFPRRTGTTPHCRPCGYVLEGIDSDRCPECGQYLSPRTIIRGRRVRRPYLAAIACLLLLLGLMASILSLSDRFRSINWYMHKPAGWVIADLRSVDSALQRTGWIELDDR